MIYVRIAIIFREAFAWVLEGAIRVYVSDF